MKLEDLKVGQEYFATKGFWKFKVLEVTLIDAKVEHAGGVALLDRDRVPELGVTPYEEYASRKILK